MWLQDLGADLGVRAVWNGLTRVEALATKYPEVVDYHLHGGRSRVEEAYQNVAAAFGAENTESGLTVLAVQNKVSKALLTLEDDPHYRYEHRFGSGELPALTSRPGLVLHLESQEKASGRWTSVDIIARCAASTAERPIRFQGSLQLEPGGEAAETFQEMIAYGAPFISPDGAYTGELDAPGGLGGPIEAATISMWSPGGDLGADPELHLEVIAPDGTVLGAVDLNRTDRSQGKEGVRTVLEEAHGVFTLEDRYNLSGKDSSRKLTLNELAGKPVSQVFPALTFLAHCRAPNYGRLSRRHTPPSMGAHDANLAFAWPKDIEELLERRTALVGLLTRLQNHSAATIKVPDSATVGDDQPRSWQTAARILAGEESTVQYDEGHAVHLELDGAQRPAESFEVALPLEVMVGDQHIELGLVGAYFENPVFLGEREVEGRTLLTLQTPERRIRYRALPEGHG